MGQSSYTSFRIESKDLFHNSGTVWFTGCFQRPETNRHLSIDCDNRFLFTARVSPYSIELGQEHRVFTNSPPRAFYEPGSNILGTLAGNPSPANRVAAGVFPAGQPSKGGYMLARREPSHISPLQGESDSGQPADARTAFFRTNSDLVSFLVTQCPKFLL